MKKISFSLVLLLITFLAQADNFWISKSLQNEMLRSNEKLKILIVFKTKVNTDSLNEQFNSKQLNLNLRAKTTINLLQKISNSSQQNVYRYLKEKLMESAQLVDSIRPFWICNAMYVQINPNLITSLYEFNEIEHIELATEKTVFYETPIKSESKSNNSIGGTEPGLLAINAPAMWQMGYTGHGRLMYSVDTGCWPQHPAIGNRFLGNYYSLSQTWLPFDSPYPADKSHSHGTHTIGTTLGLDATNNDTIGVAFNAYWIAADPIVQDLADVKPITVIMTSFEWALNPDGDTATTSDIPDVINNSWGIALTPGDDTLCQSVVSDLLNVVETAGIVAVFSAGNEGPNLQTVGRPAFISNSIVNNFSVGALDGANAAHPIAGFSSRGPSVCGGTGSIAIKPEVSAPGVNVRSCVGINSYDVYSGTSMAGPHVTGAVLLLREAFPNLGAEEIKLALYYSAIDLGDTGEDNVYGMGMIDVFAAYNYLANTHTPASPAQKKYDLMVQKILLPAEGGLLCSENFTPKIILKNNGDSTLQSAKIFYAIGNSQEQSIIWNGTLNALQVDTINLGNLNFNQSGLTEFIVRAELLNSNIIEYDLINNRRVSRFNFIPNQNLPFHEDFEQGIVPDRLVISNPDFDATWDTATCSGLTNSSLSAFMACNATIDYNRTDGIICPVLNFQNTDSITLKFSVGYKLRSTQLSDSLKVLLSNNCGESFNYVLYNKGGSSLSTSTGTNSNYLPQLTSDWREETIDLSNFSGQSGILIKFLAKNRKGNYIALDNIWVYNGIQPSKIEEIEQAKFIVFPNPAKNKLQIKSINNIKGPIQTKLYTIEGKLILSENNLQIDLSNVSNGLYLVEISTNNTIYKTKLIVEK